MTTTQIPLFYDSYEDAVKDTCTAIGRGSFKHMGALLWPAMPADDAGRRLAACLDPAKRDKLSLGELQMIRREARKAGVHILAAYEARDAGYAEPQPISPEDEAAQLQREFIASVKALQGIQARIDQNAGRPV